MELVRGGTGWCWVPGGGQLLGGDGCRGVVAAKPLPVSDSLGGLQSQRVIVLTATSYGGERIQR